MDTTNVAHTVRAFGGLPLPGLWASLFQDAQAAYQTAAQQAEQWALTAINERAKLPALVAEVAKAEALYDLNPPGIPTDTYDDEGRVVTRPAKNDVERKAARVLHFAGAQRYQSLVKDIERITRLAQSLETAAERAVLDCRLARLRLDAITACLNAGPIAWGVDPQGRPLPRPTPHEAVSPMGLRLNVEPEGHPGE